MSCECCWSDRQRRELSSFAHVEYSDVCYAHEARGCVCTKNTEAGRRARAGQFWDEEAKRDTREGVKQ